MYLELHQIIKPSSTTSHMHISVFIGRIGQRAGSDAHAPQRPRCLSLRNPFLCDISPTSVIAPGSDRIRRALTAGNCPKQSPCRRSRRHSPPVGQLWLVSLTLRRTQLHSPQYTLMAGN